MDFTMFNGFKSRLPKKHRRRAREYIYLDGAPWGVTGAARFMKSPLSLVAVGSATLSAGVQTILSGPENMSIAFAINVGIDALPVVSLVAFFVSLIRKRDVDTVIDTSGYYVADTQDNAKAIKFYDLFVMAGYRITSKAMVTIVASEILSLQAHHFKSDYSIQFVANKFLPALEGVCGSLICFSIAGAMLCAHARNKLRRDDWKVTTPPKDKIEEKEEAMVGVIANNHTFVPAKPVRCRGLG